MYIRGKTALITGASRGIGQAIAVAFAKQGAYRLILVARDAQRLETVAHAVRQLGTEAIILPLDLTEPALVSGAIAKAWRDYGAIDILVNCAGVAHQTPFLQTRLPYVQTEIATNLLGLYTVTRLIARRMAARQQGHIVNVSSLMGRIAAPTMATYSATKFAIVGFTEALRAELSPYNVQVSLLLPSLTNTDMVRNFDWFRWVKPATPEQVAQALIVGLQRRSAEILVDWQSHIAIWGSRIAPALLARVVRLASPQPLPPTARLRTNF